MKLIIILLLLSLGSCGLSGQDKIINNTVIVLRDSIKLQNINLKILNDSIIKINQKQVLTKENFIKVYKYDRLYKYYRICVNKPSQWIYYKGWSIRVFTN